MANNQVTFKVTNFIAERQGNGKMRTYNKGTIITEAKYLALKPENQRLCKAMAKRKNTKAKGIDWTQAELQLVVDLYLKNVNPDGTIDMVYVEYKHAEVFPHRDGQGVQHICRQIVCFDAFTPQEGLYGTTVALLKVLADTNPERFWPAVEVLLGELA